MAAGDGDRAKPEHLIVGHIAKAHGTRGELFVMPLTDRPADVFTPERELILGDVAGAAGSSVVTVVSARPFKRGLLLSLEEIGSRAAADELAQRYLLLPLAALPPLEEGELFYHELLGLKVATMDGVIVGVVREVYETEPHHLLEIEGADGKRRLVPFAERIVKRVDVRARELVIDPPEGLLEL